MALYDIVLSIASVVLMITIFWILTDPRNSARPEIRMISTETVHMVVTEERKEQ